METNLKPEGFVLEHPAIDVADPVAVAAWWCENLGFTMTRQKDDETHTTFIVDASGRVAFEMYRAKTTPAAPDYASMDPLTLHFGFTSKDVDADIERLTKAGATLVSHEKSPGFDGAMMRDPFGIPIQFVKREKSVLLK
ncbi:MAG: VOC family protein [Bacteroidales bacterium]|nr:VOC family protein [Bacteroidales bacterium]